jgi:uridine kinase
MNNLIIGIAGGSGSGKTTLACRLKALFGEDEVRLISHDSYYKRHDELPFEERCKLNYDHPDAFDNALLIYHLQELKAGRAIDCPVYDYADHNRSNEVQHIEPAPCPHRGRHPSLRRAGAVRHVRLQDLRGHRR